MDRIILHCDLNSFFASASALTYKDLDSRIPFAVCGDVSKRHGIILAKNQAARRMGVKTAQTLWEACSLCPQLVTVPPDYPLYIKLSETVRAIYDRYSGYIEPFGIDECWLDVTAYAAHKDFGESVAHDIRRAVKKDTGLTVSVGVSWNKIFAKLGSDYKKPDAVTVIGRHNYRDIVWPLPSSALLGVGRATERKLEAAGINTIGELARSPVPFLKLLLGKNGETLHAFASGNDLSPVKSVEHHCDIKGIGNSMTTVHDLTTDDEVREAFLVLAEMVCRRARHKRLYGRVVGISLRDNTFSHITRQMTLPRDTCLSGEIAASAMRLYHDNWDAGRRPIRQIGVRLQCLSPIGQYTQLNFFDMQRDRLFHLEFAKDDIISRFGPDAITRASLMATTVAERGAKEMHTVHPLSYFRK